METYIRSFIAIDINEDNRKLLSDIQNEFKKINTDLKFVESKNIHLTLHFLGNVEIEKIQELEGFLLPIVKKIPKFKIKPQSLGAFPNIDNPRVIWIGIQKNREKLIELQGKIGEGLKKLGLEIEERKFHPHLTLARIKSKKNIHLLIRIIKELPLPEFKEISVREVILFKSTLTPKGPVYKKLATWELKD